MQLRTLLFTGSLLGILLSFSCAPKSSSNEETPSYHQEIDTYIKRLMQADEIPGMAIAVIQNGQMLHQKNYGLANLAHKVPVTDSTLFRIYSTSKLITSVAVFQLIERNQLSLEDSIGLFIEKLPDPWKKIKVKHLLSHSSGLPEYKDIKNQPLLSDEQIHTEITQKPLLFETGARFSYNQTNFWFLKQIIEKISQQKLEEFVLEHQFNHQNTHLVYASNSLLAIPNRVPKYEFNQKHGTYEISSFAAGERSLAGNGLNINLENLIRWNTKLDNDQLLKTATKKQMMQPFDYQDPNALFGYSWGIFGPEDKRYYGFAGGGVSAFMKFINHDLTIIVLSNGFKQRPVISNAINYISGVADPRLLRKDRWFNEEIRLRFILNPFHQTVQEYQQMKSEHPEISFERALNQTGYHFLYHKDIDKALSIFELYTKDYPESANAFDSYGEAYFMNKQYDLARRNYQKSLDLNPENKNAAKMLVKIAQLNTP